MKGNNLNKDEDYQCYADNPGPCTVSTTDPVIHYVIPKQATKKKAKLVKPLALKLFLCFECGEDCSNDPKLFEDNSICCTRCNTWLHFKFVGFKTENDVPNKYARWLCSICNV